MNICILSNIDNVHDAGGKKVSARMLSDGLSERHNILHVNARSNMSNWRFWKLLRDFEPDIIHIVLRPSLRVSLYSMILEGVCRKAKITITALQPPLDRSLVRMFSMFSKPDLVLTLSRVTGRFFADLGCKVAFLNSCGVDTRKFSPVDKETRLALRQKYNIARDKFVILHVGHINKRRNLLGLVKLQKEQDHLVLIVCDDTRRPDKNIYKSLEDAGCVILRKYFEHVEEFYQLADCYVFLTRHGSGAIEVPLSVLEAMSCNLPVITTRFGAIPELLEEGEGLFFVEDEHDVISALADLKSRTSPIKLREKVMDHSWENIAQRLETVYTNLHCSGVVKLFGQKA